MGRYEIDDNSIEHGLGVGGGRGRPKGSRNGYINPNAAYMKNYEIQGEVADPLNTGLQPQNQQRQRTWAPAPQSNGPTRRMTNQEINTRKAAADNTARAVTASRPASSVQGGKMLMEKLLKEQTIPEQTIPEQTIPEQTIPEQTIPEQTIKEQYLTETKPIETNDSQPKVAKEAKSDPLADAWNGLLDWGKNAWNDVSGVATRAIDTGKGWEKSGLDWLNNNVLNPASEWGSRAVSDVSSWIGDRGRELDRWRNGYDETIRNPSSGETRTQGDLKGNARQTQHVNGVRDNIGDFVGRAGETLGQLGNNIWNGYETGNELFRRYHPGLKDMYFGNNERGVSGAFTDPIGFVNQQFIESNFGKNGIDEWTRDTGSRIGQGVRNAVDTAGRWIGDLPQNVNNWWNGNQVIRGNENGTTSVEGNPGLKDVLFDGYAREVTDSRGIPAGLTNAYQQGTPDTTHVEHVPGLMEQAANIPQNVGNLVQRNIVDPVTNTVKTYLVDPVTNTAVAVADTIQRNVINPVGGTLQQIDQNVIQPAANAIGTAANWTYNNVLEPVGNFVGQQVENLGNTVSTGYRYMQNSGDSRSNEARSAGVSPRVVDDLNRTAANGGDAAQTQRDQMFDTMNAALRNGVSPQVVDYLYDAMTSGAIYPSTFMSNLSGLANAAPDVVNRQNAYYTSDPYGARRNNK